jgi:hypothetical protein
MQPQKTQIKMSDLGLFAAQIKIRTATGFEPAPSLVYLTPTECSTFQVLCSWYYCKSLHNEANGHQHVPAVREANKKLFDA